MPLLKTIWISPWPSQLSVMKLKAGWLQLAECLVWRRQDFICGHFSTGSQPDLVPERSETKAVRAIFLCGGAHWVPLSLFWGCCLPMCALQNRNESHEDHSVSSKLLLLSALHSQIDLVTKKKGRFLAAWKCFLPPWPRERSCSMLFKQVDTQRINSWREMGSFCK